MRGGAHSLPLRNRFSVLEVEHVDCDAIHVVSPTLPTDSAPSIPKRLPRLKHWEKKLPRSFTVAATASQNSLLLPVELETTDTNKTYQVKALLDSGATGLFIDAEFVRKNGWATRELSQAIPVFNVDGTPNEAGSIHSVIDLILRYDSHAERAVFAVTSLGKQDIILGYTWLRNHNPEVDWTTQTVRLNRCPRACTVCRKRERAERQIRRRETRARATCRAGLMPSLEDCDSDQESDCDDDEHGEHIDAATSNLPELEDGERLFAANVVDPEFIRATQTTSQRLAEAFARNSAKPSFRDSVPDRFCDFEDVFSKDSFDELPASKPWDHAIELVPGAEPVNCKIYPLAPSEQVELDQFIEENLASGRIRPSKSPMAAPVFFVKKKDGSLRLVQDYRKLNLMTIKNRYPLPLIPELIHKLRGAKYFTKFDVRWGYNNLRIKEGDEWKAAFRTNRGLFEPLVMFFGLTNSPATFQTMMNDIFRDLIAEGVVCVYMDDILIYTKTREQHREVTRRVLEILRQHKLYLRAEKCEFEKERIEYLGLIISEGQVEMDPVKVDGVAKWPVPTSRKEVQSFLGFANFYRRFIEDFSAIARPLFNLTKADVKFQWGPSEQMAFDEVKA